MSVYRIDPRKMAVALDDSKRVNGKLNQLKDHLIEFFHLPEVEDDTIWENDRNEFLKSIEKVLATYLIIVSFNGTLVKKYIIIMNIALLTAAGSGSRMGQDIPKQFMNIDDCPVIIYTMQAFQHHPQIDAIAVICLQGWEVVLKAYASQYGITKLEYIFPGGDSNFHSIRNGLLGLQKCGISDDDIIVIQDGVRPLVSEDIISRNIETCKKYGYAVTGLLCKEVIMEYHADENNLSYLPIPRERLVRTQTPHTYKLGTILKAQQAAIDNKLEDTAASCQLVAQIGIKNQHLVLGSEKNGLKLTNVEDIELFKALKHVSKAPWLK